MITISISSRGSLASETIIKSSVSSCPSPTEAQWQKSNDGNTFVAIDITQPEYCESNLNPNSPSLVIASTTFAGKQFYRLRVSNIIGVSFSNTVDLKLTRGMSFVNCAAADQNLLKICQPFSAVSLWAYRRIFSFFSKLVS